MTNPNSDLSNPNQDRTSNPKIDDPANPKDTPPTQPLPPEVETELGEVEEALESTTIGIEDRS